MGMYYTSHLQDALGVCFASVACSYYWYTLEDPYLKLKKEGINPSLNDLIVSVLDFIKQCGTLFCSDQIVAREVNESNKSNEFHNTIEHWDCINNCNNFVNKKLCNNHDKQNSSRETDILEKFVDDHKKGKSVAKLPID